MKIKNKVKLIILLSILFTSLWITKTFASSISLTPSKKSVSPGETITVTIKANDATGRINISTTGGKSSISSIWVENNSQTFTVSAGTSGTVKIVANGEVSNSLAEDKTVSASTSVTINVPTTNNTNNNNSNKPSSNNGTNTTNKPSSSNGSNTTNKPSSSNGTNTTIKPTVEVKKSSDSSLSELSIEGIEIQFNKDIKEYAASVPHDTLGLNVNAKATDSKAKVIITGNTELKEGENTITIAVTAEDGTVTNYIIKVKKLRVSLKLESLVFKYKDQEENLIEIPLEPIFEGNVKEYSLKNVEYWVNSLLVEAKTNIEGAIIDIEGADNLQIGENNIKIIAKMPAQSEEEQDEILEYNIKIIKTEQPTTSILKNISAWYKDNEKSIILGALGICIIALVILSLYIIVDYNKYKNIIKEINENKKEINENKKEMTNDNAINTNEEQIEEDSIKIGKRFK